MKTRCPECEAAVSLFATQCPECGGSVSAGSHVAAVWNHMKAALRTRWHRLWGGAEKTFTTKCPRCGELIPFRAAKCPRCQLPSELQFLATWYGRPLMALLRRCANTPERARRFWMRVFQMGHFALSVLLLWLLLRQAEARFGKDAAAWGVALGMIALYVPVSLLVLRWFLPAGTVRVMRTLWPLPKLSLLLNYITVILTAMLVTDTWKLRSAMLLSALAVAVIGFFLFATLAPAWDAFGKTMDGEGEYDWRAKNPNYRGRGGSYQPGKWS